MLKTGIVMKIEKNKAYILTQSGEFVNVYIQDEIPTIGEIYTGKQFIINNFHKRFASIAAIFLIVLVSGFTTYAYYTPVTSVVLKINPSLKLQANIWNKIINITPLNSDGEELLKHVVVKNKSIDTGLTLLVESAKQQNYINEDYITSNKTITVDITSSKNVEIGISNFQKSVAQYNVDTEVNNKTIQELGNKIKLNSNTKHVSKDLLDDNSIKNNKKEDKNNIKQKNNNNNNNKNPSKTKENKEKINDSHSNNKDNNSSKKITTTKDTKSNNGNKNSSKTIDNDKNDKGNSSKNDITNNKPKNNNPNKNKVKTKGKSAKKQ